MIFKVYIQCARHKITRVTPRKFLKDSVQQHGKFTQQAHESNSLKDRMHVASKKCIPDDNDVDPNLSFLGMNSI